MFPDSLAGDNHDYVRFIVLTSARSGSSFLIQSLRSHPEVVAFGEILGPGNVWFNTDGFPSRHRGVKRFRDRDPLRFLDGFVFRGYEPGVAAVGFKAFCSHLENPRFQPLVEHLRAQPRFRIIHLTRRNLLRAYLSEVIRSRTGVGWIYSEGERNAVSVELDPDACEAYFVGERAVHARYAKAFEECEVLPVRYEDLVASYDSVTASVQRFLDLEPEPLGSPTVVQQVRPLREVIRNYAGLEEHFRSTRWAEFFD